MSCSRPRLRRSYMSEGLGKSVRAAERAAMKGRRVGLADFALAVTVAVCQSRRVG